MSNLKPFPKGVSGNPGGKPKDARNRLTGAFIHALADDFQEHGAAAIERCRKQKPEAYIRAIAALCPKEVELKRPLQEMEDAELLAAVRALESYLSAKGPGSGDEPSGEPTSVN